jgi:hypothetical protein
MKLSMKLSMIIVLITHDDVCDDVDDVDDVIDDVDDDVIDDVIKGEFRSTYRYEHSVSIAGQTSRSLSDLRLPSGWLNVTSMHWSLAFREPARPRSTLP